MEILPKKPSTKGLGEIFTGDVWFDVIAAGEEPSRMRVKRGAVRALRPPHRHVGKAPARATAPSPSGATTSPTRNTTPGPLRTEA
jgi:hypothetical protein